MLRTVRSPPMRSPIIPTLLETRSEPDLSPAASVADNASLGLANVTTRPSNKRFRCDDGCMEPDRFEELKSMLQTWKTDQDKILNKLVADVTDLKQQNIELLRSNKEFEKSIEFFNVSFEEMKARLDTLEREHKEYEKRCNDIATDVSAQRIASLELKIESMEQRVRQCNIEICNVPEKRAENLLHIVESIGTAVNFPLSQGDILSVHRVPHARQQDSAPKNIIVKLKSQIACENILSAYRKVKSVKSDQIGIAGAPVSVYLNEHLTLKNKALFREAKKLAAKNGYKYVWIRNATILVRERDGTSAFAIRSDNDLTKIGGKTDNINAL